VRNTGITNGFSLGSRLLDSLSGAKIGYTSSTKLLARFTVILSCLLLQTTLTSYSVITGLLILFSDFVFRAYDL